MVVDVSRDDVVFRCQEFVNQGSYSDVNFLFDKFKDDKYLSKKDRDFLFFFNGVAAFYVDKKKEGYECCKHVLFNGLLPEDILCLAISNLFFFKDFFSSDKQVLDLFNVVDEVIQRNSCDLLNDNHFSVWESLYFLVEPLLTKSSSFKHRNKKKPVVFLSMTSCKRLELFKKTVYSIINQWEDVDMVDYWFCVDDNSSEEDRKFMKKNFSWFDFHFKEPDMKGHRVSMNIIWDKLKEVKPKYWIHIEDDFVFHRKMPYIYKGLEGLKLLEKEGVFQVLFNRNYAEVIRDVCTRGHISLSETKDFVIHGYDNTYYEYLPYDYPNSHYWPYFSFRPALTVVEKVLEVGNFDSKVSFFEQDYGYKWANKGFKSAFFNCITNRHIGRLTSERSDSSLLNAYELNEVDQGL